MGAVLFHAPNGLRIVAGEFERGPRLQRQMPWAIVAVWVVTGTSAAMSTRAKSRRWPTPASTERYDNIAIPDKGKR